MSLSLITLLAIFTCVAFWKSHARAGVVLLFLTLGTIELIGSGIVPAFLLAHLQHRFISPLQPHWKQNNAIILLASGMHHWPNGTLSPGFAAQSRLQETLRLYHQCKQLSRSCTILISGGALRNQQTESHVYRNNLLDLGILPRDVLTEQDSKNTFENAKNSKKIITRHQFDYIVLVSSGFHLQRANLFFQHFKINSELAPSDYFQPFSSSLPLSYNFFLMDIAIHEYIGMAYFHFLHPAKNWFKIF